MLLRREEGRCFSQEAVVLPQYEDFLAQAQEYLAFGLIQRSGRLTVQASAGAFLLHPGAQRLLAEVQLLGDRADAASGIDDQASGFPAVLLGKGPALLFMLLISDILSKTGIG